MRLIQFRDDDGLPSVAQVDAGGRAARRVANHRTTHALAVAADREGTSLDALVETVGEALDVAGLLAAGRVLSPLTHPDPAHCLVTGTGLTHLGSAAARDAMHQKLAGEAEAAMSDSMRMFKWGLDGGRPAPGRPGAQPEWFFKGDGQIVAAPGAPLASPSFALDGGEEPELVGLYVVGQDGTPRRLGFAIGNEFSDHVTERQNYLYLAHSKLRACAVGPELRTGALPDHLAGTSRVRRGDQVVWEKPFVTGEANMCHSIANLEYHHFKYAAHRRPGDVHLHFFGTATLSFADGVRVEPGDRFEIELPELGAALVNPLAVAEDAFAIGGVRPL